MNQHDQAWQKLVASARRAQDDRDTAAPYGFATRVAALALSDEQLASARGLFERFSWRALAVAGVLAIGGVATNYASSTSSSPAEEPLPDDTAVTVVFDIS